MKTLISSLICLSLFAPLSVIAKNDKGQKHGSLPPGLQKKQDRGQPLPPGWQKKLRKGDILELEIYHHAKVVAPVDVHGHITVSIEGHLLKIVKDTRKIVEILTH